MSFREAKEAEPKPKKNLMKQASRNKPQRNDKVFLDIKIRFKSKST